ncbi:MAG: hypothetical protein J6X00_03125 [Clostridia bacterium]|nr:hypothetical protein [Clostridia bacterium]
MNKPKYTNVVVKNNSNVVENAADVTISKLCTSESFGLILLTDKGIASKKIKTHMAAANMLAIEVISNNCNTAANTMHIVPNIKLIINHELFSILSSKQLYNYNIIDLNSALYLH